MIQPRRSGILLHPTSLPGRYGVGAFNHEVYAWIDFLHRTRQTLWQVLPLGPTGYGDSPYQSFSSFAGNPYLIALEPLAEEGLLDPQWLAEAPSLPASHVDYGALYQWKLPLLRRTADRFRRQGTQELRHQFEEFCTQNRAWLDDYALFMALKNAFNGLPWNQWEMPLRSRRPQAMDAAQRMHADAIYAQKFSQWLFYRQWTHVRDYARARNIQVVGDIPIFVAMDSSDAWANPTEFFLDDTFQPTVVAGVPPDYFSATGQLWGNPLYHWDVMAQNGYRWWMQRIAAALQLYDVVRIDHFRGFAGYWEVPAGAATAEHGRWVDGPGAAFFEAVQQEFGQDLPIIAEDLGEITPDVVALRDQFQLPGMKILQFAFGSDAHDKFLPHNYTRNFVVYPGTHDNDTTLGWYRRSSTEHERDLFRRYFRTDGASAAWTLIEAAYASVANMAVVSLQDVLELDTDARMNLPGRAEGNWTWRYQAEQLDDGVAARLREVTELYGRGQLAI